MQARFVVDLFNAAAPIDAALARRAADHMLAWPKTYHPTARSSRPSATCWDRLRPRIPQPCSSCAPPAIAEPLAPPADWRRPSKLVCTCMHCKELSGFLADPERKT
jgi:hypothetical protein